MSEANTIESPRSAGFVDRGFNHARKKARMEEEEKEIARLEAEARGEEVDEKTEEATEEVVEAVSEEDDSNLSREEKSFKKRYGDLRRHMQQKEKDWEEKLEALENRMNSEGIRAPKSDEDIEKWASEYPDVAGIVETIAAKKAQEMFQKAESRLSELDKVQSEAERKKAEAAIMETHPDFHKLKASDEFHDWAEEQPKWVQDALYENSEDAKSVARVIDLYKSDKGITSKKASSSDKGAAASITTKRTTSPNHEESSNYLRESQVAKMSMKEYEKRAEDIFEAQRQGKFIYDMSKK